MSANGGANGTNGGSNGRGPVASALMVTDPVTAAQRTTRDEIASYLNAEIRRGHVVRAELVLSSSFGTEEVVRPFEIAEGAAANDLAHEILAAAEQDTANTPGASAGFYKLLIHRGKDFATSGFLRFQTQTRARATGQARSAAMGLTEQSLELCEERALDLSKMHIELVEQIRLGRALDQGTIKALNEGWKELQKSSTEGLHSTCAQQAVLIEMLLGQVRDLGAQQIEMAQTRNELLDQKAERDLTKLREEKRIERGDKLFDKFVPFLMRKVAQKLDVPDEVTANAGAAAGTTTADGGPVPNFTARQARALGRFLQALTQDDFVGIYALLSPEKQALFQEVGAAFEDDAKKEGSP